MYNVHLCTNQHTSNRHFLHYSQVATTANMSENYSAKQTGTGGMAGAAKTPANANVGVDKPNAFDAQGSIGKQFTGKWLST